MWAFQSARFASELSALALFFAPLATVTFLLMWWSFRPYWIDEVPDAEPLPVPDHQATFASFDPPRHRNYLIRHWRGECGLAVSYWVNGTLIVFVVLVAVALSVAGLETFGFSLQMIAIGAVVQIVGALLIWLWAAVGIWRSATFHEDRGGSGFWAILAQVLVALGALGTFMQLRGNVLQLQEFGMLAVGGDPIGEPGTLTVSPDGRTIHVEGFITSGISRRFEEAVAALPGLRNVTLSSPGGRHFEAARMARVVRERELDTRVEEECSSACTFVLLAGRERTARPGAPIGFHQPSFPGWGAADLNAAIAETKADYRRAGISENFIERAMEVSSDALWLPSHEMMEGANVLTATEIIVTGR